MPVSRKNPDHIELLDASYVQQEMAAGRSVQLDKGCVKRPLVLHGLRGTPDRPLVLQGTLTKEPEKLHHPKELEKGQVPAALLPGKKLEEPDREQDRALFLTKVTGETDAETFRKVANDRARRREAQGHYPTIAELANQAAITLID